VYRKQVRRRRAVLVALIVISLILISSSVSEVQSGPLYSIQRGISAVLSPIEEGASRVLKPGRDLVNWFDETFDARGENEDLQTEVDELRTQLADAESQLGDYKQLGELRDLVDEAPAVGEFEAVTARVIGRSPTVWYSTVTVDKGSSAGVKVNDAVVTGGGLVGRVRETTRGTAQVELITDHRSAVSADVLPDGPQGIVEPEVGDPDDLVLDFIDRQDPVQEGEMLATAGWSDSEISSAFPEGIPIGSITEADGSGDLETAQRVHVRPFADLSNLELVQILAGSGDRPGVPKG
jgi:rod shape-determining protein MreC